MNISQVEELSQNAKFLTTSAQFYFKCSILFEGGTISEGIIQASSRSEAILKAYRSLEDQGVLEIVHDIDCVLLEE